MGKCIVSNQGGIMHTHSTDRKDFNKLGIGIDDLIEAYIQTVLSTVAIDKMADALLNRQSRFRMGLFKSLNDDPSLLHEILL